MTPCAACGPREEHLGGDHLRLRVLTKDRCVILNRVAADDGELDSMHGSRPFRSRQQRRGDGALDRKVNRTRIGSAQHSESCHQRNGHDKRRCGALRTGQQVSRRCACEPSSSARVPAPPRKTHTRARSTESPRRRLDTEGPAKSRQEVYGQMIGRSPPADRGRRLRTTTPE